MSSRNPPLFPVTVVGSWPRPRSLVDAFRKRKAGRMSYEELNQLADGAVLEALNYQEEAGVDIVSDGEQRRDNFYSFVVEKLDGVRLMSLAEIMDVVQDKAGFDQVLRSMDAPAFAIHNPTVTGKISRRTPLAVDEVRFLRQHTGKPIMVALPGPYLLTRSMWVKGVSDSAYPTQETLANDIVGILREEVQDLQAEGVSFIQFDEPVLTDVVFRPEKRERTFMCASMAATTGDPDEELYKAAYLMNQVLREVQSPKSKVQGAVGVTLDVGPGTLDPSFGVHVCRGNWSRQEGALLQGSYGPLLGCLMDMPVQRLVLEYATPRAGELAVFAPYSQKTSASTAVNQGGGVPRAIGLGVVNPRSDQLERPEDVVARVEEALQFFAPEQVYLNPDCGFGTFAERPMNPAEVAAQKLGVIAQAARLLRKKYG